MTRLRKFNPLYVWAAASVAAVACLVWALAQTGRRSGQRADALVVYCAAALRPPLEKIAAEYQERYGVEIRLQYGGSASLLSQIEVSKTGDLFLAADVSHVDLARKKNLVAEQLPMGWLQAVLAVRKGNPKQVRGVADLARNDVRVALGDPNQAEIGRQTRRLLEHSGHWAAVKENVTRHGVFKPTEPDVAVDVQIGSVDAAIVWESTAARLEGIETLDPPELQTGRSLFALAVLESSKTPTAALHFARYAAACDRGLETFRRSGFETIEGDAWAERPQLTFFAGSVNRRALEPIVKRFEQREDVAVNTVLNGCGILTAQMRAIEKTQGPGFPDVYMACDVYYLDVVQEMFQDAVNVSNTDIVMVVQKGNPRNIEELEHLARPGIRIALGQPEKCTIGVLCQKLLAAQGLYDKLFELGNVVQQTTSSAYLVPNVTTGAADVALAYRTDTLGEKDKLDVIGIESPLAKAVQPYCIARSSKQKHLGRRLLEEIARSRADFEAAGFNWQLDPACCPGGGKQ